VLGLGGTTKVSLAEVDKHKWEATP
jgi:hypothetical protein